MTDQPNEDETQFTILPIHGGSGRVSDPQTVREAIEVDRTRRTFPPTLANDLRAVGIDPDMPVETLKRRLLWGERVEELLGSDLRAHRPTDLTLAWLTREEA